VRSTDQREYRIARPPDCKEGGHARMVNDLVEELGDSGLACRQIIASGGVKNFLDGYYLVKKLRVPAVYGQASSFLEHAKTSYDALQQYVSAQIEGYRLANAYLRLKD
jgi:isopentenyl-diphosphate delta-isomerase